MEAKILYGLHRPFHQPLWMVKWVCAFFIRRKMKRQECFYCKEVTADFYFVMLEWLSESYPKYYSNGIPSMASVVAVRDEFGKLPREARYDYLKSILQKQRVSKIEKQIYSTYKASGYYINLAKEKLNLIDDNGNLTVPNFPSKYWRSSNLYQSEKIVLLEQILKFDGVYFLSLCLMQKEVNRYELPVSTLIYDFMKEFYSEARFDFVSRSHGNYYVVRKYWEEILGVLTKSKKLRSFAKKTIIKNSEIQKTYDDIVSHLNIYKQTIKRQQSFNKLVVKFNHTYKLLIKRQQKSNDYINLHDICSEMGMGYSSFNSFLSEFYERYRTTKNIFFINIVSTIDQRKRFYVRMKPVLSIKIMDL